jgi:predicted enzyme related to lactoylglutathione lyase
MDREASMTMTASPVLGRPLWYELMTTNMAAAEDFYTKVVGWTTAPFEGGPTKYSMWTRGGNVPIGGVMTLPDEIKQHNVPPHWTMYVGVPKLEEAVAHVQRLGGGILSPVIEVPNVGRMQTMRDPQGAAFALYEPSSEPQQAEPPPEVGDVSWIELLTTDAPAAMRFYQELFGWKPTEAMDMGPMGTYQMFGRQRGSMGGMFTRSGELANVPPSWWLYFRVPDVHAAKERVTSSGGQIVNGPMEVPGGDWIVQCLDPQGAAFALHHKKAGT